MRTTAVSALIFFYVAFGLAEPAAQAQVLSPTGWNMYAADSFGTKPPPQSATINLIGSILGLDPADFVVCSYGFADIDNDTIYELVASLDFSGRHFCNQVIVIAKVGANYQQLAIKAWNASDIADVIQDLSKDGKKDLVIKQSWSDYSGMNCVATWTRIYQFSARQLSDVSNMFPQYYKNRLNQLLQGLNPTQPNFSCTAMEIDKIQRVLGLDSTAGVARAQQWKVSPDADLRAKAIDVFRDIGSDASKIALAQMIQDPNPTVGQKAARALGR